MTATLVTEEFITLSEVLDSANTTLRQFLVGCVEAMPIHAEAWPHVAEIYAAVDDSAEILAAWLAAAREEAEIVATETHFRLRGAPTLGLTEADVLVEGRWLLATFTHSGHRLAAALLDGWAMR